MPKNLKGYFFVLLGATLLGSIGVLGRAIYQYEPDPIKVVTYRGIIAAVLLITTLAIFRPEKLRLKLKDLPFFAVYGFLSVTMTFILFFYSIKYTSVAMATILIYTYPVWIVVLSFIILKEKINRQKIPALLLAFSGCLLVTQIYNPSLLNFNQRGIVYGLLCGLGAASYTLFGKKATSKYDSWTVVSYAFGFGTLFLLFFRNPLTLFDFTYPKITWLWIFTLALVPTILGYSFYTRGLLYLEASKAGIIAIWEVVVASFLAYAIFDEKLTLIQISGAILILWSIIILKKKDREVKNVQV
ncbi:MAG: EamA family transporter [candidate division Zixibacteria bacterium]|nr:EamA family transporter [candidate division Zixibacteria bacterium]